MIRTFLRASGRTEQEERLDWTEVGCLVAVPGPGTAERRAGTADPFECMELVLCKVGLIITCVVPHPCCNGLRDWGWGRLVTAEVLEQWLSRGVLGQKCDSSRASTEPGTSWCFLELL